MATEKWREWYKEEYLWGDGHRSIDGVNFSDRLVPADLLRTEAPWLYGVLEDASRIDPQLGLDEGPVFRLAGGWYSQDCGNTAYALYHEARRVAMIFDDATSEEVAEAGLDRIIDDRSGDPDWDRWLLMEDDIPAGGGEVVARRRKLPATTEEVRGMIISDGLPPERWDDTLTQVTWFISDSCFHRAVRLPAIYPPDRDALLDGVELGTRADVL